jgi:hypothetical protein
MKRPPQRKRAHRAEGAVGYSYELLERLAHILVHTGHSPRKLEQEFRQICQRLNEPKHPWEPTDLEQVGDLSHIIAHWHADPRFLDSQGRPAALPFRGRGTSLSALIERVLPSEDTEAITQVLLRVRAIRLRAGCYRPTARHLVYRRHEGRVHALKTLMGMLRTVGANVASPRESAILERVALNPNFPIRALPAFHRHLKARASRFLWPIDGDMRRYEASGIHGPRTRLGVGVFAFEEPILKRRGGSGKPPLRRKDARARAASSRARRSKT